MFGFQNNNTEREALRFVCSALAREYRVKIHLTDDKAKTAEPANARAHADIAKKEITVDTTHIEKIGSDALTGTVIHEIGHIRHTDTEVKAKDSTEHDLLNFLEDERIEEKMCEEYTGAQYFLEASADSATYTLETKYSKPPEYLKNEATRRNDAEIAKTSTATLGEAIGIIARGSEEEETQQRAREIIYYDTLGLAYLHAHLPYTDGLSTGVLEADKLAEKLGNILTRAKYAPSTEAVLSLAKEATKLLAPFYPLPARGNQKGASGPENGGEEEESALEKIKKLGGKVPNSEDTGSRNNANLEQVINHADITSREYVEKLKRKLIARMRDNEHQKYTGNHRKGSLDKKTLARVARDSYRVYKKREELKGKDYALSIVLDCSGSMWCEEYGIHLSEELTNANILHGMSSALILMRTFRALGFPASLTLYGYEARTVQTHRQRLVMGNLGEQILREASTHDIWASGGNETHAGIKEGLAQLKKSADGKHRIMVIITDGGLNDSDIEDSRAMLEKEERAGMFSPLVLFIGFGGKHILKDKTKERTVNNPTELIPACVELMSKLDV